MMRLIEYSVGTHKKGDSNSGLRYPEFEMGGRWDFSVFYPEPDTTVSSRLCEGSVPAPTATRAPLIATGLTKVSMPPVNGRSPTICPTMVPHT